jgi:hypothetical protein
MAERVYGDASIPHGDRLAMTLARYLRRHRLRTFNARTLRREAGGLLRKPEDMTKACEVLEQAGLVRRHPGREVRANGRPSLDYQVHARVYQVPEPDAPQPAYSACAKSAKKAKTPSDPPDPGGFGTFGTFGTAGEHAAPADPAGVEGRNPALMIEGLTGIEEVSP